MMTAEFSSTEDIAFIESEAPPYETCADRKQFQALRDESGEDREDLIVACYWRASQANDVKTGRHVIGYVPQDERSKIFDLLMSKYDVSTAFINNTLRVEAPPWYTDWKILAGIGAAVAVVGVGTIVYVRRW